MPRRDTLEALIADLGKMPAALGREMRPALVKVAQPILLDARRRASWSSRIPAAISIRTSLASKNPGVRLVVDARMAPHARPYEMGSKKNGLRNLRHPVFADTVNQTREEWTWVTEPTRPFFFDAFEDGASGVAAKSAAAVIAAARTAGFH
jgi:hypothetical protein